MNPLRVIDSITGALKRLAFAGPMLTAASLGFTPSAHAQLPVTSGLVLRMDASQITGTADGAQLDTWADTSGAANNAVRQSGSSAGYPMYVASGINGQPVVRFNSANGNTGDYFRFNRISTIRSVFWVIKGTQANGTHFLLGDDNSYQFHRGNGGNAGKLWDSTYASSNITGGATKLMGGSINGTTTSLPSGFQLVSLVTTGSVEANQICQDRSYNGSWQGDIAEILIYNRALSGPEENQVGYYLGTKYGLTTTYTAPQAIPTDSLIHYDFNSVSGTTVTNSGSLGSAADGTLANASLVTGQFDNALSFTGSSSGVITNNNVAIGNAFTLACWVSTTNANGSYRRIILNDYQQSGYLGTDGNGKYLTILKDNFHSSATAPDTSGAWHHLAMTWDGTTQRFYYDGTLDTSAVPTSRNTTYTQKFGFGCNLGLGESWNGKMDDAFVFGRALSLAEIGSLYLNTTATIPAVPTGVAATPASSGTVNVSWSADANATSRTVSVTNTTTSVEQLFTTAAATSYAVTGLTNGTSYDFKVSATNGLGTSAYSSVVTATPTVGTAKDILTFVFPGQLNATISGTNISVILPVGAAVTALAPTYTVSAFATGSPASGTTRDFTSPQTYTITAEDGSTKIYTVTVTVRPDSRPPVTSGLVVWLAADRVNPADTNQVRIVGADTFVKLWNDGSGNSKNATQAVNGDQPKYIASGVGGKPVLRFTQVNDDAGSQMELGDLSASFPAAGSMFAVSTISTDGRYNLFDNRNTDSRWVANTWSEAVPGVFRDNRQGMSYAAWPQTGSHVFAMESGSGVYRFLSDGAVMGSNAGGNFHSGSGQNWIIGDRPGNGQQLNGDIPEFLLYNRILTADEANAVGAYLAAKYAVTTTYPALPAPTVPAGVTVTPVTATSMSVSWTATNAESYNVSVRNTLTSAVQVFAVPTSPFLVTGLTGGTPYEFSVQSINSVGTSAYSSPPVVGTPAISSAKNILTFLFPGQPDAIISGTDISVTMPLGTDVTALAPTYTISALATSSPASGTARDFTSPKTYTVTAEDLSTQVYTVTVTLDVVATNFTWTTGAGGNWSDSTKWVNDLANGLRPSTGGQPYYTFNFNQAVTATNDLSANYVVNKLNFGNTVTIAGTNSIRLTANGATLPQINQNSGNQVTLSSPINLAADTTLGGSSTGTVTIGGAISGAGKLTKTNGGLLSTLGNNTYTGGTLISAGTVYCGLQNPSPLGGAGSVNVTIQSGATLSMDRNQITGSLTINGGKVATGNGWADDAWNGPVALSGNSTIDVGGTDGALALNGVMSGTGSLIKLGTSPRTLALNAANTFNGNLTISQGVISLGAAGSIDNAALISIAAGATFDVSAKSAYGFTSSNSLSATGAATAAKLKGAVGGTVNLGAQPISLTFAPASGSGDLTHPSLVVSQGALVLSGNTISVVNNGAVLEAGIYRLIQVGDGTSGILTGVPNTAAVSVTGTGGLAPGFVAMASVSSGNVVLTVVSAYDVWANGTFTNAFTDKAAASNPDGDTLTNLQEYAFGTDPTTSSAGPITYAGNVLTGYGPPEVSNFAGGPNGVDYRMVFCRRKNPASLGLTYTAEFSVDFATWSPNAVTPTVLATDAAGVMEVVSVPYPFFIVTVRGVEKPTFSHVKVESN